MSTVKANSYYDTSGGTNAVVYGIANPPSSMGFRNRLINGGMEIDQRYGGASVTPADGAYTLDRWNAGLTQASKFSVQRSTTAPAGYINSLLVTSLSAYSVGAGDLFRVSQYIEGYNIADLAWGSASAKAVTLSFWVRSSLTGTFSGSLANSAFNRSYPFTYTVSAANTWEQKTVNIAGDTSGTWLTDSGIGIRVGFSLGAGSSYSGTAGAWAATTLIAATGATSVVGTDGATLYVTGVQLEAGTFTSAPAFEQRDYGRELLMCQRYYQTAGAASFGSADGSTTTIQITEKTYTPMRSSPTGAIYSGVTASFRSAGGDYNNASPTLANYAAAGTTAFWTQVLGFTGLTSGAVVNGRCTQSTNGGNFIALSSEL